MLRRLTAPGPDSVDFPFPLSRPVRCDESVRLVEEADIEARMVRTLVDAKSIRQRRQPRPGDIVCVYFHGCRAGPAHLRACEYAD